MAETVPVKTTQTVFGIVAAILDSEGASFSELQRDLGMAESTLYDHLQTLEGMGLLLKQGDTYRVSSRFLDMGERIRYQRPVFRAARGQIEALASETGEHASLMVEEDGEGVLLDVKKGEDAVDINAYPGLHLTLPPHAPGKAILAYLARDRVNAIIDEHGLERYTERTITDRDALFEELERIRSQGYAIDDEELIEGVKALSVPVRTSETIRGAITIGGPTNRMRDDRIQDDLLDRLTEAANIVELNLTVRS